MPDRRPTGREVMLEATEARCGFLTEREVAMIASDPQTRLACLLVRCGAGRFLAPAQDVRHFIDIIERDGRDYVRDVSVPPKGV